MDPNQRTTSALQVRALGDVTQLLQRFENILSHAPSTGEDRNAAAVASFQMEVEAAALTRAAEDVLSLVREMKQAWLDGKLDTIGTSQSEKEADKYAIEVAEKLKRLSSNQNEQKGESWPNS